MRSGGSSYIHSTHNVSNWSRFLCVEEVSFQPSIVYIITNHRHLLGAPPHQDTSPLMYSAYCIHRYIIKIIVYYYNHHHFRHMWSLAFGPSPFKSKVGVGCCVLLIARVDTRLEFATAYHSVEHLFSKMTQYASRVSMAIILIFLRNAWILLISFTRCIMATLVQLNSSMNSCLYAARAKRSHPYVAATLRECHAISKSCNICCSRNPL